MREILFRGKITQDEWVYGFYENVKLEEATIHYINGKIVSSKTVGQYTGLTDKYGKKIFVGDIIIYGFKPCVVKWDEDNASFCLYAYGTTKIAGFNRDTMKLKEIIGNIYDSPELLEGVAQ